MGKNGQPDPQQWISTALGTYEGRLLRYAQRILKDEERARDAVQDTFLKLCREDSSELNGRLEQWLYTVCRNQALDILRKESRMSVLVDDPQPTSLDPPEQAVEQADETTRVLAAMEQLPASQQECLRLKFEHGLSYRTIADITGLSVSHVGVTIHQALKRLRSQLQPERA